jgi:hypothetical protein
MENKGGKQPKKKTLSNEGQLYVSNLPDKTERSKSHIPLIFKISNLFQEKLKDYFNSFGKMTECRLVKDKSTSKYIIFKFSNFTPNQYFLGFYLSNFRNKFFSEFTNVPKIYLKLEKFRGFAFITYEDPSIA